MNHQDESKDSLSAEHIQGVADSLDIDAYLLDKYQNLQDRITRLKIKFEAHKINRGVESNG
ncbi:hypothetical protein [Nostoc sp. UHCC 0870]|uniref:hypothetical protein n=1 Tax=Nostoc sp. UHCC 0870 TaxID=2914041 RepID=UPI001EDFC608|nr:hypothetical protein [Nostoc sp. UHCC 0870]UKP01589.1 hypothetical protein L6494_30775 [Nostoc sp. UHCC 0870]